MHNLIRGISQRVIDFEVKSEEFPIFVNVAHAYIRSGVQVGGRGIIFHLSVPCAFMCYFVSIIISQRQT